MTKQQQQHPITPPPDWDADAELEACQEWLRDARNHKFGYDLGRTLADRLRAARRPKPLSLVEHALTLLDDASTRLDAVHENTIRRALERLQELEKSNE